MATIEKRVYKTKTTYRVKIELKGFPPATASFERISDAKRWAQETETKIRENRYFKTSASREYTLADAIERYLKLLPEGVQSTTDKTYQLNYWKGELGSYAFAHITPALILSAREKLADLPTERGNRKRTPATVNRYTAALSHLYTVAYKEWGWADENPFHKLSKLKEPKGRVRFLSDDERVKLLDACQQSKNPFLYDIVVLCLLSGARRMEINGLRWRDVDLQRKRIIFEKTKNGEVRAIPLSEEALEILEKRYDKEKHLPGHWVFPSMTRDKPIDITTAWENALTVAGIRADFRFHDLRHSAASYLAMNGASLTELSEILGHKTLSMVKRYAHFTDSHTAQVVQSMNRKILGGAPKKDL